MRQIIEEEIEETLKKLNIALDANKRKIVKQYATDWVIGILEGDEEEEPITVDAIAALAREATEIALVEFGIIKDEEEEEW